jgi:hypothetical protein
MAPYDMIFWVFRCILKVKLDKYGKQISRMSLIIDNGAYFYMVVVLAKTIGVTY